MDSPMPLSITLCRSTVVLALAMLVGMAGCAGLTNRDPLMIDVAGIEPLPGEGMELNLAVRIRVQNPNDSPVEYDGIALMLDVNGRRLASGVSSDVGTVPRYGELVFTVPITISAFDAARQIYGVMGGEDLDRIEYRVRGKLEGGVFGTRRFDDHGVFTLAPAERSVR